MDAVTVNFYDCKLWNDLLKKKEAGMEVTREDFDRILGHCQAVLDMPAAFFAKELMAAYPDAKVILTVRDTESWFASVTKTLRPIHESWLTVLVSALDRVLLMPSRWMHPMFRTLDRVQFQGDFARNGRRVYEEHNARVRALAPPGRLLEYHVREGWAPLCAFLGREVPEEDAAAGAPGTTPHLNSSASFIESHHGLNYHMLAAQGRRLLDVAAYAALVAVVTGAAAKRWGFKWPDFV
ncbi:hypothetical protein V2A60_002714 [Cordyceps javanica]